MGIEHKEKILREAFSKFLNIKSPNVKDYTTLLLEGSKSMRQGDGLNWQDVEKVIEEVLHEHLQEKSVRMLKAGFPTPKF